MWLGYSCDRCGKNLQESPDVIVIESVIIAELCTKCFEIAKRDVESNLITKPGPEEHQKKC